MITTGDVKDENSIFFEEPPIFHTAKKILNWLLFICVEMSVYYWKSIEFARAEIIPIIIITCNYWTTWYDDVKVVGVLVLGLLKAYSYWIKIQFILWNNMDLWERVSIFIQYIFYAYFVSWFLCDGVIFLNGKERAYLSKLVVLHYIIICACVLIIYLGANIVYDNDVGDDDEFTRSRLPFIHNFQLRY